jgi:hypothetical protein
MAVNYELWFGMDDEVIAYDVLYHNDRALSSPGRWGLNWVISDSAQCSLWCNQVNWTKNLFIYIYLEDNKHIFPEKRPYQSAELHWFTPNKEM